MALNAYDSSFSCKQDAFARLGDKANNRIKMNADDMQAFQKSDFMQMVEKINDRTKEMSKARDRARADTDPTFDPSIDDFKAQRSFQFDKFTNYYRLLGINEYASQADVKKAYKDLSLVYHPDKTASLEQDAKEQYAEVFIELKNAYVTLSDNVSRRQYDLARDKELASCEVRGSRMQERKFAFDPSKGAEAATAKRQEPAAAASKWVEVHAKARLEKFAFGGRKTITRSLRVKDAESEDLGFLEFEQQDRDFHIDIPPGAVEPVVAEFKRQGDEHTDAPPDSLRFLVSSKPHELVERRGCDLSLLFEVSAVGTGPHFTADVPCLFGRHILLWGSNTFFGSYSRGAGLAHLRILGEGLAGEGALSFDVRLQGEQGGEEAAVERQTSCGTLPPALQRRTARRRQALAECAIQLAPLGGAAELSTNPACVLQAYAAASTMHDSAAGGLFAISLASQACSSRKAADSWQRLQGELLPLLRSTGFLLLRAARAVLPRPLASGPAPADDLRRLPAPGPGRGLPSWRERGNKAFARGEFWTALGLYSGGLEEVAEEDAPERARLLSNRSACFFELREYEAALVDGRKAAALRPTWSRAWVRVGRAAAALGGEVEVREAMSAHSKIVEVDPSVANVALLDAFVRKHMHPGEGPAREAKQRAGQAWKEKEWAVAVAALTVGLARLDGEEPTLRDLRGVLLSNRSAAFAKLGNWSSAAGDAKQAVEVKPLSVKVLCRLGLALLGLRHNEEAYTVFAEALQRDHDSEKARRGRDACLIETALGRSLALEARCSRRWADAGRAAASTRVFAISDVHLDHGKGQWTWLKQIHSTCFQQDVLIVAGNLAIKLPTIIAGLSTLKAKFRRVFYTVGADELRISVHDGPDSLTKLQAILQACDRLGVDVCPAAISEAVSVAPLLSWYSFEFDWMDPHPDSHLSFDTMCRWPMDVEVAWRYMLKLNEHYMQDERWRQASQRGTAITFSHFLPRQDLPFHADSDIGMRMAKFQGCVAIEEQLKRLNSKLHVYGRSHIPHAEVHDGVMYVNQPLGYPQERLVLHRDEEGGLLMQVHDGRSLCTTPWDGASDQAREQPQLM